MMVAGRYRIIKELGSGAMGQVFEVVRTSDDRVFAMKVMFGQSALDAARFSREAEIAAKLSHPHLISVVDVGLGSGGLPFIVMDLVRGGTLADRKLEKHEVGRVLMQVARGLLALHEAGIIHRDLKPSNILVEEHDDGTFDVRLADFGIARAIGSPFDATQRMSHQVTKTGSFLGTPQYMAPEQAEGAQQASHASDVFSFGVVAYELWAHELPFAAPVVFTALANRTLPEPPNFSDYVDDPHLRRLLRDCCASEPEKRPSLKDVSEALDAAYADEPMSQV
jgi:serine/threonine-protein kinase